MRPISPGPVLLASAAGFVVAVLIVLTRKTNQRGRLGLRQVAVAVIGSAAVGVGILQFARIFAPSSPVFSAVATLLVTEWAALLNASVGMPLPSALAAVSDREGKLWRRRWTAVPAFGRLLRNTPLRGLGGNVYLGRTFSDAPGVAKGMIDAEAVHTWAVLLTVPWIFAAALQGWWAATAVCLCVHAPLNLYPILHLRLARARLRRCSARFPAGQN